MACRLCTTKGGFIVFTEVLLLVVGVLVLFGLLYVILRNEIVWRKVTCPRTGVAAEVEVVRRSDGRQQPVRVRSCSLFDEPRRLTCEQDCLSRC
jgi:hypothetical protein